MYSMSHFILSKNQPKKTKSIRDTILDNAESLWDSIQKRVVDDSAEARLKKYPNAARHY
jgi:hypothetical protein